MLFQAPYYYPTSGGRFQSVMQVLLDWGVIDALLPFLLIFALIFAILMKIKIFKQEGKDVGDRRLNGIIAMVISAMVVAPHVMRVYPPQADPVLMLLSILPSSAVILVVMFMVLVLLGMVAEIPTVGLWAVAFGALVILGLVVLTTVYPAFTPAWFAMSPDTVALIVVLIIFGLVVYFVMREEPPATGGGWDAFITKFFKKP
ncbi:hypothetical protein HY489_01135 [Candidatus Woesearchaeota archaeon]|nr:hypothetical protein [Candidatus Woesearchaeota archaeon]